MATLGHPVQTLTSCSEPGKETVVELRPPAHQHGRWELSKVIASFCPGPDPEAGPYSVQVISNGKVLWDVDLAGPGPHDAFIPDGLRSEATGYVERDGTDERDPERPGDLRIVLSAGGEVGQGQKKRKVVGKLNVAVAPAAS